MLNRTRPGPVRHGVTLVEILVVVGIIAVLIALIVPVIRSVRERSAAVTCSSNQKQLMTAFLAFAADHDGQLPGNHFDAGNPDPDKKPWLLDPAKPWDQAPKTGTLFKYMAGNKEAYRCPYQQESIAAAGSGTNSRFDYASFLLFTGAQVKNISATARFNYKDGRPFQELPIPIIVEEDPSTINGSNMEGGHSNIDKISHHHRGGGYYASIDGSTHYFKEPLDCDSWSWQARTPKGNLLQLGYFQDPRGGNVMWGFWNGQ